MLSVLVIPFFLYCITIGTIQESASQQEGEDINRALNLEEVVQESSNEWQSISNVFR